MPKPKADVYVETGPVAAKASQLDVKLPAVATEMTKALKEFFEKERGFTTKAPSGKASEGYKVTGSMLSLESKEKNGLTFVMCEVSLVLSELPKDRMIPGRIEGTGGVSAGSDLQGDAEFAAATAVKEAATMAVKQIERAEKK
ncbi:MAG: hypothetical protein ACRCT8_03785 [Lacipirellulaceae bacterium]